MEVPHKIKNACCRGFLGFSLGLAGSVAIATVACKTIAISRLTDFV